MKREPIVAVAIPTHNRCELLQRAIQSALSQTMQAVEIHVLDDASTDATADVVARFDDPRLVYVRNDTNIGMAANWNLGFAVADTEYVTLLHDDDYWDDGFLEQAVAMLGTSDDIGMVYSPTTSVDLHGNIVRGPLLSLPDRDQVLDSDAALERFVRKNEALWPGLLWRRRALAEVGGVSPTHRFAMDWQLHLRIAARNRVGYLATPLGYTGVHEGQFTTGFSSQPTAVARDRMRMLQTTIPDLPIPESRRHELLATAMRALAETQLVNAWDRALGERPDSHERKPDSRPRSTPAFAGEHRIST